MVAQTGIIDTEIEYNNRAVQVFDENNQYNSIVYNLIDIDLGLTERPRAQINLSKELTNIQIRLANGRILFDTNQSVSDLYFGEHRIFGLDDYYYNVGTNDAPGYRLRQQLEQLEKDRQEELINIAMDEELMVGATLKLTYRIKVLNIGEVDYLDRDFYYIGKTNNTNWENVSKTNANTVIDYVTNEANYEVQYQNDIDAWKIISSDILLQHDKDKENENSGNYNEQQLYRVNEDNDYINSYYEESLLTYNVLLTTKKLSADLLPRALETDEENLSNSSREVYFVLSTLLTNSSQDKNLIYTNLAEIIETSNTWGRRMHLSRTGDQGMPYQSEEKSIDESTIWTRPKGPGSDSAQKVQITAPTGENRDYNRVIIIALITLVIVIGGVYIIKKKVLKK